MGIGWPLRPAVRFVHVLSKFYTFKSIRYNKSIARYASPIKGLGGVLYFYPLHAREKFLIRATRGIKV